MVIPVESNNRKNMKPIFKNCRYDRVLIDSTLDGHFGNAYVDDFYFPTIGRLDSGAFTMLGGNPEADSLKEMLSIAPIFYVTPQHKEWKHKLEEVFGSRISVLTFTDFVSDNINRSKFENIILPLNSAYELKQMDKQLAERTLIDIGNEYFFERDHSIDDFIDRGIGYCIMYKGRIVSAATAMARSSKAIDVEIETVLEYQRRGLGTMVGARLVAYCIDTGIEPKWLAENLTSERLALKLGYSKSETYETFEIKH